MSRRQGEKIAAAVVEALRAPGVTEDLTARASATLPTSIDRYLRHAVPSALAGAREQAVAELKSHEQEIASAVAASVEKVVRRRSEDLLPELAREAVKRETPSRAELTDRLVAEVTRTARTAVEESLAVAVPEAVATYAAGETETLGRAAEEARLAANEATEAAVESIERAVTERLEELRDRILPSVVRVVLPDRPEVDLRTDTHAVLPDLLTVLAATCHALLVGPAGTGKSMLAMHAAEALGLDFQALSLGPTTPMSKIFGYNDAHGNYVTTPFRRAFEDGGVMLFDELDNGHPGLLAELNQALALGVCAFADSMVEAHRDFRVVATANTYGTGADRQYLGRQALDAATLDRFVVVDVPIDEKLEQRIALAQAPNRRDDVRRLLGLVHWLRRTAREKELPVLLSPRVSIDGAKLLAAGATMDKVIAWRITRGMSYAHRRALGLADKDG